MNRTLMLKAVVVGVIALVLMLPIGMIRDLVKERQERRDQAVAGIAEGWGKRQVLAGPYVVLPYERRWTEVKRETVNGELREIRNERAESRLLRLPASAVQWDLSAEISEKARGIYKARLYGARVAVRGTIPLPARAELEDGASRYRWGTPSLVLGVSDPLGIRAAPDVLLGGRVHAFAPGTDDSLLAAGIHAPLQGVAPGQAQVLEFSATLEIGGSEALAVAPLGADTTVAMRADWPHPSFQGRFLPARHEIGAGGFSASWKLSRFAAQSGSAANCAWPCSLLADQVAVSFIEPAGLYQQLERASKYGFLFIGLTAAAFMLFELLRGLAIHPIQYALVGLALAMFFLLLTALSEHIDFAAAYAAAALACVGLITAYLVRVLHSARAGLGFGAALSAVYAMLYALLKAEDYALLGGALLLFALLAAVMLATRRVDWYQLTGEANA